MISPVYIQNMASVLPSAGEPDYKALITNPSLRRRMSRVVKMGVACAMECMAGYPAEEVQAIITATGLGCLADTEKFMNNLLDNNEQLLNPTAFIQSTFNTVGAQIALLCKNHSYNLTYAHRGLSFESALLDGMLRLHEGDSLVLVGAFDELTLTSIDIQQRLGLYRNTVPGEGSQFFLLSSDKCKDTDVAVYPPNMFSSPADKDKIETNINHYLEQYNLKPNDFSSFITADTRIKLQSEVQVHTYKDKCGDYHTASAYALWYAATLQKQSTNAGYTLIYNQWNQINHSLILLR